MILYMNQFSGNIFYSKQDEEDCTILEQESHSHGNFEICICTLKSPC